MNRSRLPLTFGLLAGLGLALPALSGCTQPATEEAATGAEAPAEAAPPAVPDAPTGPVVATLTAVSGPAGVRTPGLPEGTFLGKDAKLSAGQRLIVPPGTLAELALEGGGTLRFNEDTEVVLPAEGARQLTLVRGEVVAIITAGQPALAIAGDDDVLTVERGEARAYNRDSERDYAVVYGAAKLSSGSSTVDLGPGATVQTPIEGVEAPQPVVSLRPLEETSWSRSFDAAARMADAVPAGVGSLTARRAGESVERYSLSLVDQKVNVTISGRIALTEIEQTFYNEAPLVLEGTYRFPIPADATISGLALLVGNTWEDAAMLEKERARSIFKQIVEATVPRDPALLEWEQGNIFKLKIFPIPGRGERKIRLRYTQVLPAVGDTLRYRYPLSGASSGASGTAIGSFAFNVDVDREELPADAMESLRTPMATLERRDLGDRINLSTTQRDFRPVHDLGVDIPLPAAERRMHAETHLDKDGQAYFMVAVEPDLPLEASARPTRYAFVLDRSHSTTPELWTVARALVSAMTEALGEHDQFTVLACDTACDVLPGGVLEPSAANLEKIDTFLEGQTLAGASDVGGMMRAAAERLSMAKAPSAGERVIVYLGDGNVSAGELAPDELLRHVKPALEGIRVQSVALGARSDLLLLGALAEETGGDLVQADAKDDLRELVRELRLRAAVPVARDVELELPKGMVYVHPSKVGSLRAGDPLVLVGKLSGPVDGELKIKAKGPDGAAIADTFAVKLAADRADTKGRHTHLPRTWAAEEIEDLTVHQGFSAKKTIIELSKRYTVLSRYTALLVLENDAMYREFNVVRNAGQTDEWRGKLGKAAGASADASVSATPPPAEAEATAESAAPLGEATTKEDAKSAPMRETKAEKREEERPAAQTKSFDADDAWGDEAPMGGAEEEPMPEPEPLDLADEDAEESRPPAPPAKKSKAKTSASSQKPSSRPRPAPALDDPFYDGSKGALGYGSGAGGYGGMIARRPRLQIRDQVAPSAATLRTIDDLRARRDADPTSRKAHRRLVQAAIYYGVPEAFDYARAWAEADPDHAPALLAVADLLAARGEPIAPRAYGSALEVRPFDRRLHQRLADALLSKGDTTRACAHLRAIVSIDPKKAQHHADLVRCLGAASDWELAQEAIVDGRARLRGSGAALDKAASQVAARSIPPLAPENLHGYADLKATLTWSGDADLDVAFVDSRGRRLSALRREGILVRERDGEETVTMRSVSKPVFVEVSRKGLGGGVKGPPVSATLKIKTGDQTKTFDITSDHATLRLAKVSWSR
ncbi:MAG: VIT domain-containing protein [Nannocystaceae bacterium]